MSIFALRFFSGTVTPKRHNDEKNIPTFEQKAPQQARFPRTHGIGHRPSSDRPPPQQRPQATHRLFRQAAQALKHIFSIFERAVADDASAFLCSGGFRTTCANLESLRRDNCPARYPRQIQRREWTLWTNSKYNSGAPPGIRPAELSSVIQ